MTASINRGDGKDFRRQSLINRTGGTLTKGKIVTRNFAFAATSGQAMVGITPTTESDDAAGYIMSAAITPTVESSARWVGIVENDSVADNENFQAIEEGEFVDAYVADGTNAGEFLIATNTSSELTPYTLTELTTLGTTGDTTAEVIGVIGMAMEANSSGAAALKKIRLWGRNPNLVTRT